MDGKVKDSNDHTDDQVRLQTLILRKGNSDIRSALTAVIVYLIILNDHSCSSNYPVLALIR